MGTSAAGRHPPLGGGRMLAHDPAIPPERIAYPEPSATPAAFLSGGGERFRKRCALAMIGQTPVCRGRKGNSDLSDASANAPAMRSNRFFFCTPTCVATDAPDVGHPSLRTLRRFFRFREAMRWENSVQHRTNDLRAGMGKMSIVRAATEVPATGRPSLSALLGCQWNSHWKASPER